MRFLWVMGLLFTIPFVRDVEYIGFAEMDPMANDEALTDDLTIIHEKDDEGLADYLTIIHEKDDEGLADYLTIIHEKEPILSVHRSDLALSFPWFGIPVIDSSKIDLLSKELNKLIRKEAVNAGLDDYGNIVPEEAGFELNQEVFKKQLYTYFYQDGSSSVSIPLRTIYPRIDSELLASIRTKMIGYYATYYNSRNKARSHNISLATEAINNQVVFPGETFSFNRSVGKRTKEKGYLPAPIIVRGELSEGVGGGICQVSSTLFNAADRSGLHILQRYSHSKRVAYVPPGRDATVSWYGPDFTFKNDYNQPVLIQARARNGMMIVMMFSSDEINFKPKQVPSSSFGLPPEIDRNEVMY